jgi:crotonobetainyl-CoA:carnitine CoA-transferase CaiB-like acyl-CoA transferase
MCGLMLAFAVAAAVRRRRRTGEVARIDFSMIEALLWTMAEPLLTAQLAGPTEPMGNGDAVCEPHGAWRAAGEDAWVAIAVPDDRAWWALCGLVPALSELSRLSVERRREAAAQIGGVLTAWLRDQDAAGAAEALRRAGVPAAVAVSSVDLVADAHLRTRGFWDAGDAGATPGLPWQASFGRARGPAPELGEHTDAVLRDVLGWDGAEIERLRSKGVFG